MSRVEAGRTQRWLEEEKVGIYAVVHRDARVVKDMATGKSKGYGFVSFFNKWVSPMTTQLNKCTF